MTVRQARDAAELSAAMDLRVRVFCDEQGVDHTEELDEHDQTATHLVVVDDESGVVATCRVRPVDDGWKLERMVVERSMRGKGVGAELLAEAETRARAEGAAQMILNAQTRAQGFYGGNGYEPEGDVFLDAGIDHIRMTKAL